MATIYGTSGNDTKYGTTANDVIYGLAGNDKLYGLEGDDTLYGGEGNDTLYGGEGNDNHLGGDGNDLFISWLGTDYFDGGDGFDTLSFDNTNTGIGAVIDMSLTSGQIINDTWGGGSETVINIERIFGTDYDDTITIGSEALVINAGLGDDTIYGGSGNDSLIGGFGNDYIDGGDGEDLAFYNQAAVNIEIVSINPSELHVTDTISGDVDILLNIEKIVGSNYADVITLTDVSIAIDAGDGDDTINGGDEDDVLDGGNGSDIIYGGSGRDDVNGGDGNDWLYGNGGDDWLYGGNGDDHYYGGDGDDYFSSSYGTDYIDGGDGFDTLQYMNAWFAINLDLSKTSNQQTGDQGSDTIVNVEKIIGSEYADTMLGNADDNILDGYLGNDSMNGRDGNDTLSGGDGNDFIDGGDGNDTIYGDKGEDTLRGGIGDDYIDGGEGDDIVYYDSSAINIEIVSINPSELHVTDTISGDVDVLLNIEKIVGSDYADVITLTDVSIAINAGDGDDTINGGDEDDVLDGGNGSDIIYGGSGRDDVNGGDGNDWLYGNGGDDWLYGGAGDDHYYGGDGDDYFSSSYGTDYIDGGDGFDTLQYMNAWFAINLDLSKTSNQQTGDQGPDTIVNVEKIIGSEYADIMLGDLSNNVLDGYLGNDTIDGGAGDDILIGGAGNDSLDGGDGYDTADYSASTSGITVDYVTSTIGDGLGGTDTIANIENVIGSAYGDTFNGDASDNTFDGGAGDDTLNGAGGNDMLIGGEGNDTLDGGADNDTADYSGSTGAINVNLNAGTVSDGLGGTDTVSNIETYIGTAYGDSFTGDAGDTTFDGGAGNDTFVGGAGNDTFIGGSGTDTASYRASTSGITADLAAGTIVDGLGGTDSVSGIERVYGSDYNDILNGSSGMDRLYGYDGDDIINGAGGNDILEGGIGDDTVSGGDGNDTIEGNVGNDMLYGNAGNDTLTYNLEDNIGATDSYDGGLGTDTLRFYLDGASLDQDLREDILSLKQFIDTNADPLVDTGSSHTMTETGLTVSNVENLNVYVNGVLTNTDPIAADDAFVTDEDTQLSGNVLADNGNGVDTGWDDDLSVVAGTYTTVQGGTVVMNSDGSFTYTPAANYFGADSFDYTLEDSYGYTDIATVNFTVNSVNDAPVAAVDSITTDEDVAVTFDARSNDTDIENDPLDVTSVGVASHGSVVVNGDGTITYTPDSDYNGSDTFSYTIDDGNGGTDTETVNVTVNAVNDEPVLTNNGTTIDEDNSVVITSAMLSASDVDNTASELVFTVDSIPVSGTLYNNGVALAVTDIFTMQDVLDNLISFTPDADVNGLDGFDFTVSDGTATLASDTFVITVNPINDAPVAADDSFTVNEDTELNGNLLIDNGNGIDSDIDLDTLNVVAETISTANNGTVVINSDGSFSYTSAANYNGVDNFDYTLEDGQGASDKGTVNITVNAVNDAPILTNNGGVVDEDGVLTISTTMLNAIDVDNADSELTFTINGLPSNGMLFLSGVALAIDDSFTMQDVINDAVSFIPDADVNGLDGFDFTLSDGTATLASDTFAITVNPINDNPIAVDDAFSALADVETTGNLLVDNGYGLDSDIDGDTLDVTAGTYATAEGGSITVLANGDFTYTPDDAFTGTDSVDYTLDDGNGGTDIGTATFTVAQNVINGTASADSITGTNAGDSITGGEGDDTISGGAGNDTYHFARGDGADLVDNYDTLSLRDLINFDDDIAYDQLWFAQDGNDLEISVIGTNDSVTVDDWYSGNDYQVDLIQSGDGYELTGGEVQTLVNAMSSMTPPPFGQTDLTPSEHAILDSILDNVWDPVV